MTVQKKVLTDPAGFKQAISMTDGSRYILDPKVRLAVRMAWATGRPLLVVGEAGCGKTELAQALASQWQVPLLKQVVHARTEHQDLFFHFDAVARLADAQVRGALGANANDEANCDPLNVCHYLRPGPLWWALDEVSAKRLNDGRPDGRRFRPPGGVPESGEVGGSVVLIDEVDKGSDELAEGLLEVLDRGVFTVPLNGETVHIREGAQPFIMLTSNGARDLSAPFLRRCIVLAMDWPEHDLVDWLSERGRAHFEASVVKDDALRRAAELIQADRAVALNQRRYRPGVAEFLYLCRAVAELVPSVSAKEQVQLIEELASAVTSDKGKANRAF